MACSSEDGAKDFRKECDHYSRGCSLVSPCCGKVYPCRLCHNDKELSHQIDRHAIAEVVCRKCSNKQPVSGECQECGVNFGKYFCVVCRLYDDADKGQFHCDKCGLCRVGGRDKFFHCDTCGLCLSLAMRDLHTCRQQMSKNNCPVCMEDIHTSTTAAHIPGCGHLLHMTCYRDLMSNGLYQCPQCQTSLADMTTHWHHLDAEKEAWQLPQHLQDFVVKINCRDCHKESDTNFHVVGLKCTLCGSYNTVRCGKEEIPEDPQAGGGILGLIRQLRGGRDGAVQRQRQEQRENDDETDSGSDEQSDTSDDSDHEPDSDGGDDAPNTSNHHGNQQSDTGDRNDDNGGASDNNQSGDAPNNQVQDDGEVDDTSYDGDESDYNEEEPASTNSEEDLFFDCRSHLNKTPLPKSHRRPAKKRRRCVRRSIEVPTGGGRQWWESEGEETRDCLKPRSACTYPPTRDCCHSNNKHSHPPVQVVVERLQVLEIWGSDYFTDSFSEVSSASNVETEDEVVNMGVACPRQHPVLKKGPSFSPCENRPNRSSCTENCDTYCFSKHNSRPSLNGHSETLLYNYPTHNGLHRVKEPTSMYSNHNGYYKEQLVRNGDDRDIDTVSQLRRVDLLRAEGHCRVSSWVKSSSEESWVTANEDWELGTLV